MAQELRIHRLLLETLQPSTPPPNPPGVYDCCSTYWVDRYVPGQPTGSQLMMYHVLAHTVTFPAGLASSQAACVTAPAAETVYSITHDGTEVGTCTFSPGANAGVFAAAADFTIDPGGLLGIVAPASPDASQADVTFTIVGNTAQGTGNPRPVNLYGEIKMSTSVTGRLTFVPSLAGRVRTGKTLVNGRLSVTHDLAIFNNV